MSFWVEKNWKPLIRGSLSHFFYGKGFFTFLFEFKEDRALIFCTRPYFLEAGGMYLNKWTPDFSLENGVPSIIPVWVRLLHLPLQCLSNNALCCIGNSIGRYFDWEEPKVLGPTL
jgi:hypothetical protein